MFDQEQRGTGPAAELEKVALSVWTVKHATMWTDVVQRISLKAITHMSGHP